MRRPRERAKTRAEQTCGVADSLISNILPHTTFSLNSDLLCMLKNDLSRANSRAMSAIFSGRSLSLFAVCGNHSHSRSPMCSKSAFVRSISKLCHPYCWRTLRLTPNKRNNQKNEARPSLLVLLRGCRPRRRRRRNERGGSLEWLQIFICAACHTFCLSLVKNIRQCGPRVVYLIGVSVFAQATTSK